MSTGEAKRFRKVMKIIGPKKRRASVGKTVKKYVKREINRGKEINVQEQVSFGGGSGSSYSNHQFPGVPNTQNVHLMKIIPDVPQGDERDERDGAKIRLQNISGTFYAHIPASLTPNTQTEAAAFPGIQCRLLILSCKQVQAFEQFRDNWNAGQLFGRQFLKKGSEPTGFQGDLWSIRWPVNTQLFTKHYDKMFTLKRGYTRGDTSSGALQVPEVAVTKRFRIKCRNKILQYNDPSNDEHTNWSLFGVLLYCYNVGTQTDATPGPVYGNCFTRMTWKDL